MRPRAKQPVQRWAAGHGIPYSGVIDSPVRRIPQDGRGNSPRSDLPKERRKEGLVQENAQEIPQPSAGSQVGAKCVGKPKNAAPWFVDPHPSEHDHEVVLVTSVSGRQIGQDRIRLKTITATAKKSATGASLKIIKPPAKASQKAPSKPLKPASENSNRLRRSWPPEGPRRPKPPVESPADKTG